MKSVTVGATNLLECGTCEGIWLDVDALQQLCAEREKQAAVLGMPAHPEEPITYEKNIRYLPCPVCHQLMNRLNFAQCSFVIVDVCKSHGTWFDKDELRRTIQFIRDGGLEKSRLREIEQLKDEQRRLSVARLANAQFGSSLPAPTSHPTYEMASNTIDILLDLLK